MNRDDDFIGRLEDYLETFDGVTPLPGRVRDAVRAGLPGTRQVRPARGPERMLAMASTISRPARWGLAAAVLVAAVVLGAAVVTTNGPGPDIGGVPPTPAPSPSVAPSPTAVPSPTPAATTSEPRALSRAPQVMCSVSSTPGCLAPGTYRLSAASWPAQITFDVPADWFRYAPASDVEGVLVDSEAKDGSGWGFLVVQVGDVSRDPCDPSKGTFDAASTATVDGVVAAMRSWPGFQVSATEPVEVAGRPGRLVELTTTLTPDTCPSAVVWTTPSGFALDAYPLVNAEGVSAPVQFRLVEIGGAIAAIRATDFPATTPWEVGQGLERDPSRHAADQAELRGILDSVRIEAGSAQP